MSNILRSIDHIPAFHAVMTHGSLSAAARALRMAQPTVRRHIEALEADLNTQLFSRAANGLTPTALAWKLLPMAQSVLEEAAALHRTASAQSGALAGVVRLTSSRIVATHVLPTALKQITAEAPRIKFEIAATDVAENLARRAADIAIRFTQPTQQALIAVALPAVEVGLFTAPGTPPVADVEALSKAPFVADDRENLILPALAAAGLPSLHNIAVRCDDPLAQIAHLQAGMGVGLCQVKLAERFGLVRVLPEVRHDMPAWLVVHEDQSRIARIRFVFDALKSALPLLM
ncbi:LysR family transcriptional regulator [Sulfitobacter sp. MF3-043]|uniref:LysR family transcriptional regulator n=1 Tax=Sulfitobacter sediminivivens TaxID=3252902 RepID=UPI0036DA65F5